MSETRLVAALERLAKSLSHLDREVAARHDVSVAQLQSLLALAGRGQGVRVSELAGAQHVAPSTMTRNLHGLERRGLVERSPGADDGRTVAVSLTEAGRALTAMLRRSKDELLFSAFGPFHPSDRVERAVALDRVAAALEDMLGRSR
jgi:DNA-binding MarR family transcriptional regulator